MKRNATECRVTWIANRPHVNRGPWTPDELRQLNSLILKYPLNKVDWVEVAEKLEVSRIIGHFSHPEIQYLDEPHPFRLHATGKLSSASLLDACSRSTPDEGC